MSEQTASPPEPAPPATGSDKSAGALLREAREAAGLHVGALAVSLKVPVRKLEALEADDLGQLPDAVFARALAAAVCRALKIDVAQVLARLPEPRMASLQVGSQDTPIRLEARGMTLRNTGWRSLPRWVRYVAGLLLAAAIVLALLPFWRDMVSSPDPAQASGEAVAAQPGAAGASPSVVAGPDQPRASAAPVATVLAATTDAPPTALAKAPIPPGVESAARDAVAPAAAPLAGATPQGAPIASFTARESSWVEVVDAAGNVQLRKTMATGETLPVQGRLPLTVVIGRANAVDVLVRGKPLDLASVSKNNVARFQIP